VLVPAPGPSAEFFKAFVINADNDNPRVGASAFLAKPILQAPLEGVKNTRNKKADKQYG